MSEQTIVRLIREVTTPGRSGPHNGQYALQNAFRQASPPWLKIGGTLQQEEIPWFWSWEDWNSIIIRVLARRPFVIGPNVLFADRHHPCNLPSERILCASPYCSLMFTESPWYRDLIQENLKPTSQSRIVLWPYPIDPWPQEPLPAEYDVLIYAKGKYRRGRVDHLILQLMQEFPNHRLLIYRKYRRTALFDAARRSRCCVYLSEDDRGPLALAEILLAGCPAVGVPKGSPWLAAEGLGTHVPELSLDALRSAIKDLWSRDRSAVRAEAARLFDTRQITQTIVDALSQLRLSCR